MSGRLTKKHRASLKLRVEEMNEAKSKYQRYETSSSLQHDSATVSGLDDSVELPAPSESDESSDDNDYDGTAAQDDYKSMYRDWVAEMNQLDQQRIAMMHYDNYREWFGLLKTDAARQVADFLSISEKTVRTWRKSFLLSPRLSLSQFSEEHNHYSEYT